MKKFVDLAKKKNSGFRLMGFGHRVYKNYDPRAKIIKVAADKVMTQDEARRIRCSTSPRSSRRRRCTDPYFVERKLYPNVDFYSGIIYRALGIPTNMFTVMFAIGRLPGWIAHWKEMMEDPTTKICRPRQIYTGPPLSALRPRRPAQVVARPLAGAGPLGALSAASRGRRRFGWRAQRTLESGSRAAAVALARERERAGREGNCRCRRRTRARRLAAAGGRRRQAVARRRRRGRRPAVRCRPAGAAWSRRGGVVAAAGGRRRRRRQPPRQRRAALPPRRFFLVLRRAVPPVDRARAGGVVADAIELAALVVLPLVDLAVVVGVALDADQLLVLVVLPDVGLLVEVRVQLLADLLAAARSRPSCRTCRRSRGRSPPASICVPLSS